MYRYENVITFVRVLFIRQKAACHMFQYKNGTIDKNRLQFKDYKA